MTTQPPLVQRNSALDDVASAMTCPECAGRGQFEVIEDDGNVDRYNCDSCITIDEGLVGRILAEDPPWEMADADEAPRRARPEMVIHFTGDDIPFL